MTGHLAVDGANGLVNHLHELRQDLIHPCRLLQSTGFPLIQLMSSISGGITELGTLDGQVSLFLGQPSYLLGDLRFELGPGSANIGSLCLCFGLDLLIHSLVLL